LRVPVIGDFDELAVLTTSWTTLAVMPFAIFFAAG